MPNATERTLRGGRHTCAKPANSLLHESRAFGGAGFSGADERGGGVSDLAGLDATGPMQATCPKHPRLRLARRSNMRL